MEKTNTKNLTSQEKNNQALKFVKTLLIIGIFSVFLYAIRTMWFINPDSKTYYKNYNFSTTISFFSLGALIAGSALAVGCLTGFVFAIPKSITHSDVNMVKTGKGYISNDNLVQVSDWLTKIIVGVGLTQLTHIPDFMQSVGEYIGKSIGCSETGEIAADGIIVYFSICGFLLAYLWTRLYFARMLEDFDDQQDETEKPVVITPAAIDTH